MYKDDAQKVMTGLCRASFVHLMEPYARGNDKKAKYSVTLLIPKSDTATKAAIDETIRATIQAEGQKKWGVMLPSPPIPIHDGDTPRENGLPRSEECRGHWLITASSNDKPGVVDANGQPIMLASEVYGGMYCRATLRFFCYNTEGKMGVGCGLGNVQKLYDGEHFTSRASAEEDFVGAPPVMGAPPAPAAPAPAAYPQQSAYATPGYPVPPAQPYAPPAAPVGAPAPQIHPITGQPMTAPYAPPAAPAAYPQQPMPAAPAAYQQPAPGYPPFLGV